MSVVYVLIVNDRHVNTEVSVFASRDDAVAAAEQETEERGWVTAGENALIDKLPEGWLFASNHPCESDHLQVVTVGLGEELLYQAFEAGFLSSSEGWNGEYHPSRPLGSGSPDSWTPTLLDDFAEWYQGIKIHENTPETKGTP